MPDRAYAVPRLAALYDALDPDRSDLDVYLELVLGLGARSLLDIGCGTGVFALLCAGRGLDVVGVDPAVASVDVARSKPGAARVRWAEGEVSRLPDLQVDVVTMTANVAQVFLTDAEWAEVLAAAYRSLRPGGHLVFETRDPAARGWEVWTRDQTEHEVEVAGVGVVRSWVELTEVALPLVSFRGTCLLGPDEEELTSDSTLRFRTREQVLTSVRAAGFAELEIREAPDRPGRELVVVARRPE